MHQLETIFKNEYGKVSKCNNCNYFQISFGNIVMNVNSSDFHSFTDLINKLCRKYLCSSNLSEDKLYIQLDVPDFFISISKSELEKLNNLLNQVVLKNQVDNLIQNSGY